MLLIKSQITKIRKIQKGKSLIDFETSFVKWQNQSAQKLQTNGKQLVYS